MKRLIAVLLMAVSVAASAQNEKTLLRGNDSIPSLIERMIAQKDSAKWGGYQPRRITSHINLEFVTSANAYLTDNTLDEASFKLNRVRLEMYGRLNRHLSYHFRQSFNKYSNPHSVDNLSSSIEYANIKWHQSDFFELVAGKQFVAFAGYEGYLNALEVREFCNFNNNVAVYQAGLMGVMHPNDDNQFTLQVTNIRSGSDSDHYVYGLPEGVEPSKLPILATANWNGWFADKSVHLMYSASAGQLAKGKNIYYLMCGNIYEKGPVIAYLDVLYSREGIDSQQRITSLQGQNRGVLPVTAQNTQHLTFIADCDYQFHPKWNAYLKGAYETAGVYEANGIFAKGRYITSWNAQACLEWFPFTKEEGLKIFAHYVYHGHHLTENALSLNASMPHTQRVSIGLVYVMPVL